MRDELAVIPRPAREPSPSMRDLLAVFFRHRQLVLVSFLGMFFIVLLYGLLAPSYEAHLKILVRRGRTDPTMTPTVTQTALFDRSELSEEELNSEVELLGDEEILRTVVRNAGLDSHPSWFARVTGETEPEQMAREVRKLARRLGVRPIRKTSLIEVSYSSYDAATSANVLRCLASAYLQRHVRVRQPSGEFDFFEQQVQQSQRGLEAAQVRLLDFTKDQGVVSAALERDNSLQRLSAVEASYGEIQIAIAESGRRVRTLKDELKRLPTRMVTEVRSSDNPELLEKLKSRLLELGLKRTELLTKFQPSYRLVQEVDTQIAEAKAAMAGEEQLPVRAQTTDNDPNHLWARAELLKARVQLNALRSRFTATAAVVADYRQAANRLGNRSISQDELIRNLKTAEANYLLYVNKREEARIGDALDQNGILNVSLAEQPSPPALPKRSSLAFGFIGITLAGVFSTGLAFTADYFDPAFRTPDEVIAYLVTPVLASLPHKE
jgi:uncharacterized protein involved in exopolysaccharide biosynthesis